MALPAISDIRIARAGGSNLPARFSSAAHLLDAHVAWGDILGLERRGFDRADCTLADPAARETKSSVILSGRELVLVAVEDAVRELGLLRGLVRDLCDLAGIAHNFRDDDEAEILAFSSDVVAGFADRVRDEIRSRLAAEVTETYEDAAKAAAAAVRELVLQMRQHAPTRTERELKAEADLAAAFAALAIADRAREAAPAAPPRTLTLRQARARASQLWADEGGPRKMITFELVDGDRAFRCRYVSPHAGTFQLLGSAVIYATDDVAAHAAAPGRPRFVVRADSLGVVAEEDADDMPRLDRP